MNDYVADTRQRLTELNRLENEGVVSRKSRHSPLNSEALIESLQASISPSVLMHHDRLRSRSRQSVAEVRHGVCSGCHMGLPIGTLAEVKRQSALLKCENCGRFIFLAEKELETAAQKEMQTAMRSTKKLSEAH